MSSLANKLSKNIKSKKYE